MTNHPSRFRARAPRRLAVLGILTLIVASGQAPADSFNLTWSSDLPNGNDYAQVVLTSQGTGTVQFQVTALKCSPPYTSSSTPAVVGFAFNSSLAINQSDIVFAPPSAGVGWRLSSGQTCDGFGRFSYLLTGPKSTNPIVFSISCANATKSSFEGGSSLKYEFAAFIDGFTTSPPSVTSQWTANQYSTTPVHSGNWPRHLIICVLFGGLLGGFLVWFFGIRTKSRDRTPVGGTAISAAGPPSDAPPRASPPT